MRQKRITCTKVYINVKKNMKTGVNNHVNAEDNKLPTAYQRLLTLSYLMLSNLKACIYCNETNETI